MKSFDWNNFGSDDTYKINNVENTASEQVIIDLETSEGSEVVNDSYFAELNENIKKSKVTSSTSSTSTYSLFKDYTMKVAEESESSVKASSFDNKMSDTQPNKKKGYGIKVIGQLIYIAAAIIIIILALDSADRNRNYTGSVIEQRSEANEGDELFGYEYTVTEGVVRKVRRKVGNTVTRIIEYNAAGEKVYEGKPSEGHK